MRGCRKHHRIDFSRIHRRGKAVAVALFVFEALDRIGIFVDGLSNCSFVKEGLMKWVQEFGVRNRLDRRKCDARMFGNPLREVVLEPSGRLGGPW